MSAKIRFFPFHGTLFRTARTGSWLEKKHVVLTVAVFPAAVIFALAVRHIIGIVVRDCRFVPVEDVVDTKIERQLAVQQVGSETGSAFCRN